MGIRSGACPVVGANAPAFAPRHVIVILMYHEIMIRTCCKRGANEPTRNRLRLGIRADACPVDGANAPILAPHHLIMIHIYLKE